MDRDVTSYYPNLVLTLGLYPQSMGPAFLQAYNKIVASRQAAKIAKRKTEANGKRLSLMVLVVNLAIRSPRFMIHD